MFKPEKVEGIVIIPGPSRAYLNERLLSTGEDRMVRFTLTWPAEEVPPDDDSRIE